jgi:uncharacterized RDD family membrane protein YckC
VTAGGEPTTTGAAGAAHEQPQFSPDERLAPYRIVRLLGRGGMGEVYEAEHVEWGRRLALKVLRQRFNNAADRARFLREGQLAASISHPHAVYIFGSEEIDGRPVISMELLPGGTLKDRVAAHGPLTPHEAAAAALDIVSGLDAAQAAGVLHRDIKPSNCFVDAEGTVKIGDFGLSISTLARDVGQRLTGFEGTPSFAAPEQLRGQALDVRADIYAVGATVYYLLTGKAPFDAATLDTLVRKVTSEDPPSPRALRRDIPDGLARLILRCLSRDPAERPASYAALAEALRPFAADRAPAAPPGARFLAWCVDSGLLGLASVSWAAFDGSFVDPAITPTALTIRTIAWTLVMFAYYVLTQGRFGATPGMQLLGLLIEKATGAPASWRDVIRRNAIFLLPQLLSILILSPWPDVAPVASLILTAMLFITVRRGNRWAAVHDLASFTRVVRPAAHVVRPPATPPRPLVSTRAGARRIGPYEVASDVGTTDEGRLVLGFDPLLRRRVWIHVYGAQPELLAARRNVSRRTRLHWLDGRRTTGEAWDAFEAPDGDAFEVASLGDVSWSEARTWLVDLARELAAASREGTLPRLGLGRLWLRADRRLVMLDFPVHGASSPASATPDGMTPGDLLSAIARRLLANDDRLRPVRLPVSMRAQLRQWSGAAPAPADVDAALQRLRPSPGSVRMRRSLLVALLTAPVAMMVFFGLFVLVPVIDQSVRADAVGAMRNWEMWNWLIMLDEPPEGSRLRDPVVARQAERYVSARFATQLADKGFWDLQAGRQPSLRPKAESLARLTPEVSPEELRMLETALTAERAAVARQAGLIDDARQLPLLVSMVSAWSFLALAIVLTLIMAVVTPGGVLTRAVGLAVVRADGREIGRGRSMLRALIACAPALPVFALLVAAIRRAAWEGWLTDHPGAALLAPLLVLAALALWTIARPQQGPHDWLAGVWVVLR